MTSVRLTTAQLEAVHMYVTDPCHCEADDDEAATVCAIRDALEGRTLAVRGAEEARSFAAAVTEGANSADDSGDRAWCTALGCVASKLWRAAAQNDEAPAQP